MKKYILYKSIAIIALLFVSLFSMAQSFRKYKTVKDLFNVTPETELYVSNKYGNIKLVTWDKDIVKFEVSIEVRDKKEAKADAKLESIHVSFVATDYRMEAKTYFAGESEFWTGVKDYSNKVLSSDNKTQIDYTIYLPKYMAINIDNKYGNILINDCVSRAEITLSNGDLKAHSFQHQTTLNMEFAYANIKQITEGVLNLGYHSEVIIDEAKDLNIVSKSSRVSIEAVENLNIKSDRDKYFLRSVKTIKAENTYTYLKIETIYKDLTVKAKYGDIDIRKYGDNISQMNFDVRNCDINITQPYDRAMEFTLVYDSNTGLFFPEELKNKETVKQDEEEKLVKTTGTLGNQEERKLKVNAKIIAANLRVASK